MKVVEIFNSIDGEGKRTGELTTFIRLWGCNLRCRYCDTKYSYEDEKSEMQYKEMSITEIINECKKYSTKNITVTGGEPLIHLDIKYLLRALSELNYNVNVETNGSISIKPYFDDNGLPLNEYRNVWFTVDYKTSSSRVKGKMLDDNFNMVANNFRNVVYKFVVGTKKDLEEALEVIKSITRVHNDSNLIYISPVFGEIEPKEIVEFMQSNDMFDSRTPIRVQVQLHKIIWPPEQRGV